MSARDRAATPDPRRGPRRRSPTRAASNRRLVLALPRWPGSEPGQFVMLSPGARGVGAAQRSAAAAADGGVPHARGRRRSRARDPVQGARARHGAARRCSSRATRVGVVGPLGTPFPDPPPGARAVIVAGGTGIASVYELAAALHARGVPRRACCSARAARRDLMGEADFAASGVDARDRDRGRHRAATRGLVTDLLAERARGRGRARSCTRAGRRR